MNSSPSTHPEEQEEQQPGPARTGDREPVRARRMTLLDAFSVGITPQMDEKAVIDTVFQWITRAMGVQLTAIFLYNPETDSLITAAVSGTKSIRINDQLPLDQGLLGEALRLRQTLFSNNSPSLPWPAAPRLHSLAVAPMIAREELLGALAIGHETEEAFSPDDVQILGWLADQAALALDNRRLFKAEQEKKHQMDLLNAIIYAANNIHNRTALLQYLADTLNTLFDSDSCFIALWDEENQIPIPVAATTRLRKQFLNLKVPPHTPSFTAQVIAANRPILVTDVRGSDLVDQTLIDEFPLRTVLGLPLAVDAHHRGAAILGFSQIHLLSQSEIDSSAQIADQISLAVTRFHLLAGEKRQQLLAETQLTFSNSLMETASASEAGLALLESIGALMDYDSGSVMLVQDEQNRGAIVASAGYTDPEAAERTTVSVDDYPLLRQIYHTLLPVYLPDLRERPDWQPGKSPDAQEVRTLLLAPLQHRTGSIVGHVTLKSFRPHAFSLGDRNQIQILCNQAAATLHNQLLLRQSRAQAAILSATNEDLQRINQVREDFVHNASHELRTPLTFIQGYAGILADKMLGELVPEQMDAVQIILKRAESMNSMIQEMVDYQRADSTPLRREMVDVSALVNGCLRAIHPSAQAAGVTFRMETAPDLPMIYADAQRLGQVFDNLFSNALKFSQVGGQVTVTLAVRDDQIAVDVADQGVGIPSDQLDLIWRRFYRVKDTAHNVLGTGLGLSIVHHIIQAHGGRIWAESPGVGSVFHVELPIFEGKMGIGE